MADAVGPMEATLAEAERLRDETIIAEALWRLGVTSMWLGDSTKGEALLRKSIEHAAPLGEAQHISEALHWLGMVLFWGPAPVADALEECRALAKSSEHLDQLARTQLLVAEGGLLALTGRFEQGRQLAADGREALLELGQKVPYAGLAMAVAMIDLLADDAPAAERVLREAHEILAHTGERGYLSTISALLALALAKQGRHGEADGFADASRQLGGEDDVMTQIYWRVGKAQVAAARQEPGEAARLATETLRLTKDYQSFDGPVAIAEIVDFLDPLVAKPVMEQALAGALAKGNVVTAENLRAKLAALP